MKMIICKRCLGVLTSKRELKNHLASYHSKGAIRARIKAAKERAKNGSDRPFWFPEKPSGLPESNRRRH